MIDSNYFFKDVSKTMRGLPFQKYLTNTGGYQIYRGDHIEKYNLLKTNDFLKIDNVDLTNEKIKELLKPKIISQRIVAHVTRPVDHIIIMSTVDSIGILSVDTVENTILNDANYSLHFLCSILNSKLISWFAYIFIFGKAIRTMDFDDYYFGKIPIHRISFTTPLDQRAKLLEQAKVICSEFLVTPNNNKIIDFVCARLSAKPEESDVVHDLLAFLAERMIEMNKEKHAEVIGFTNWLESYVIVKLDEMEQKTKIKKYYENDWNTLQDALKKNKNKISTFDIARREHLEKIKDEFNKSMSKLAPLLKKIKETDNLIDQIVYKLYGLTEEEIRIVEGKSNG
jgi:hypothetical protein